MSVKILIADDHKIMREGLAGLMQFEPDIEVVGQAADGAAAIELAEKLQPDAIIMDINLGSGTTGNAILANGQSIIYAIYYYRGLADNVIRQGIYAGAVATTGAQVAPTNAQIEATLATGTVYLRTLDMTINRTGDVDTMTFVYDHTVRNLQHPATVQNA